jgi:methyltransferase
VHRYSIWPVVLITVMIAQRISELVISARHAPRVRALGGVEYGAGHFPFIVAAHVLFFLLFLFEIVHHGAHPGPLWPLWLGVWTFAQVLRYSAMRSLGDRWNVRIWVVPGMAPVKTGPYRWLSHPNYLAVMLEFVAAPMMFGAWRTAILASLLNAPVLSVRIRCENDALQRAAVDSSR